MANKPIEKKLIEEDKSRDINEKDKELEINFIFLIYNDKKWVQWILKSFYKEPQILKLFLKELNNLNKTSDLNIKKIIIDDSTSLLVPPPIMINNFINKETQFASNVFSKELRKYITKSNNKWKEWIKDDKNNILIDILKRFTINLIKNLENKSIHLAIDYVNSQFLYYKDEMIKLINKKILNYNTNSLENVDNIGIQIHPIQILLRNPLLRLKHIQIE